MGDDEVTEIRMDPLIARRAGFRDVFLLGWHSAHSFARKHEAAAPFWGLFGTVVISIQFVGAVLDRQLFCTPDRRTSVVVRDHNLRSSGSEVTVVLLVFFMLGVPVIIATIFQQAGLFWTLCLLFLAIVILGLIGLIYPKTTTTSDRDLRRALNAAAAPERVPGIKVSFVSLTRSTSAPAGSGAVLLRAVLDAIVHPSGVVGCVAGSEGLVTYYEQFGFLRQGPTTIMITSWPPAANGPAK
jgi:hypothetical protein